MWKEHYTACHEEPGRPAGTPATEGRTGKGRSPEREPEPGPRVRKQRKNEPGRQTGEPRPEEKREETRAPTPEEETRNRGRNTEAKRQQPSNRWERALAG